ELAVLDRGERPVVLGARRKERRQRVGKGLGHGRERDAVLRTARPRDARLDGAEVELEEIRVLGVARIRVVEEALLLGVGLDEGDVLRRAARDAQITQRLLVDWEDA